MRVGSACAVACLMAFASSEAGLAYEPLFSVSVLPGITAGLPHALDLPPGIYGVAFNNGGEGHFSGRGAAAGLDGVTYRTSTHALVMFWSSPFTVLGGRFGISGVGSWSGVYLYDKGDNQIADVRGWHNLGVAPSISWNLGKGLYVRAGAFVWAPTGTIDRGPAGNGLGNIGAPYWTIEPNVAVSYLADNWNLTANVFYGISTRNTYSGVTNGNSLNLDWTATKTINRVEFGPVGYLSTQVTGDHGCEQFYGPNVCAPGTKAGVGGLLGYDFGVARARLAVTGSIYNQNAYDGWRLWTSVTFGFPYKE